MATVFPFTGRVLDDTPMLLGEGPTFDPATGTAWWFNIIGRELHELHLASGRKTVHTLPFMGSALAKVSDSKQLIASDDGLFLRDTATGVLSLHAELESDMPGNRSNDGRVHPSGALWIGTMGRKAETGAGSIYHVAKGTVTTLFSDISIPNSICFSPDGATGYFVDTDVNRLMRVTLDAATGLPTGKAELFNDSSEADGGVDGSVCDAEGHIWNARWGEGAVDRYDANGNHIERYEVPAGQTTCPAFIGPDASRLLVTSARENLDEDAIAENPQHGLTFELGVDVKGRFEPLYKL
ncbi:SMP-30/gluconolactonase/LRE family protein [Agrobacterium tumefaciens]|uniref:SMP-30/gluconolactonase/LRE family protein n=1 Tax=Agrobacterium tumefaciens TaxID=358 RepID=UPI001ADAF72F|nr:SMP-30/gluconolactonase/LRE family protein [Agrobacterium tumefaciens]QTK79471.1 SMP-30/gluconolactonase/LRE family protein [Agrobacterium tumefaciens]